MNVAFKTMKGADICITAYMPTLERLKAVGGTQKEATWCIYIYIRVYSENLDVGVI
jgi:hypothetical protein